MLNYKEELNTDQCDCADSFFCDSHHQHIITEYLRITKNKKSRKLLTKGPNYRKPRRTNFSKALIEITTGLDTCTEAMTLILDKYTTSNFKPWKEKVLTKANEKVTELEK